MALGFAVALLGLLSPRVRPGVLMPFVLLVFVMPDIRGRSIDMYGDLPLGYLVAAVAVLIWLWLEDREDWLLALVVLISAGAILTKREGILLIACVIGAGALSTWHDRRAAWPRLGASFLISCSGYVAWSLWLRLHHLHSNGPESGLGFLTDFKRASDAATAVLKNVFDFNLWLVSTTLAVAAIALAVLAGARRGATYLGSFLALTTIGATVILWSTPGITLTDMSVVSRFVGTIALSAAALTPAVLQAVLGKSELSTREYAIAGNRLTGRSGALVAGAIVLVAAMLYPATVIAKGWPRFPRASDCVASAEARGAARVVFGYANSYQVALAVQNRVRRAGFPSTSIEQDGCGGLRILIPRSLSRVAAETISRQAQANGLEPTLERPPSP